MFVQNYKLNEEGLNHFFGPLEAKIMEIIWNHSEISIKEVQQRLEQDSSLNFNTVMTVMNRLVDKSHLQKRSQGRITLYKAIQTKGEFLQANTKVMTQELMDEFGDLVVNHMLEVLDQVDPSLIQKLENRLNQLKNR